MRIPSLGSAGITQPARRSRRFGLPLAVLAALLLCAGSAQAAGAPDVPIEPAFEESTAGPREPSASSQLPLGEVSSSSEISLKPSKTEPYTPCPPEGKMIVECGLVIEPKAEKTKYGFVEPGGGPLLEGSGEGGAWSAKDLQEAYAIATSAGEGLTVAIVDAYGYEAANTDLKKYRETYGLPPCLEEPGNKNACFRKVNEKGEEGNLPPQGLEGWRLETALDLDMVSAACPKCRILLVQPSGEFPAEMSAGVETAVKLGAVAVSNSYGYPENNELACPKQNGCTEFTAAYKHPGIPIVVSAGDSGFVNERWAQYELAGTANFPAASPDVIAVGGTELEKAENARGWSEHVWAPSGGGCSLRQSKPSWQTDPGCAKRMGNDVAAVAEGVSVSFNGGWWRIGGTSVGAPLIAGIEATQSKAVREEAAAAFYHRNLYDVSSGFNGVCHETYLCGAQEGYDGSTGWGTPVGTLETLSGLQVRTGVAKNAPGPASTTLSGYVYPGGTEAKYHFEYGPSESYGTSLPASPVSVGSGTLWQPAVQKLTASLPLGTYHYRLVGSNASKTVYGKDHTFTTIPWTDRETPNHNALGNDLLGISCTSATACTAVGFGNQTPKTNSPIYQASIGSKGSGEGQLSEPTDIDTTVSSAFGRVVWILDSGNNRVERLKYSNGEYLGQFGSKGSGAGQLSSPRAMSLAPTGYVLGNGEELEALVADTANNRIVEFSSKDKFILAFGKDVNKTQVEKGGSEAQRNVCTSESGDTCQAGKAGSANGQLSGPQGVAMTNAGNIWASDTGNGRLQEFTTAGEFIRVVGSKGSGEGQLGEPGRVTIDSGRVYVADHDNRIEVFKTSGAFVRQFGGTGSGNGQFSNPGDISVGPSGNIWISDTGNNRVQIFNFSGEYIRQFGSAGSGEGQFSGPIGVVADSDHTDIESLQESESLVTDSGNGRVEKFLTPAAVPIAERWDGSKWAEQTMPALGSTEGYLTDVSCASATSCTAVGYTRSNLNPSRPLAERWDGTKWEVQMVPNTGEGYGEGELESVSCPTSSYCIAVGWAETFGYQRAAFVEQWDGKEWTIISTPEPSGSEQLDYWKLTDVSCTSSTSCTAVGWASWGNASTFVYSRKTLAEYWNGTKWVIQSTPNPSTIPPSIANLVGPENELKGVSCVSANACTAVGSYLQLTEPEAEQFEFFRKTLAMKWNGSIWSVQSTPQPSGVTANELEDVSCVAADSCVAMDFASGSLTFAYGLSGSAWSVHETNEPSGGGEVRMFSVACTSASYCTVAGAERPNGDVDRTRVRVLALPAIETEAVGIRSTEANLHAAINPSGVNTSYTFEWGSTSSYGHSVPVSAEGIGSGTEVVKVQQLISGLGPETQYHYRVVATSGPYERHSSDQVFTTKAMPPHWYGCTKQAAGRYTSSTCTTEGAPNEWESVLLKAGEKTTVTAKGNPIAFTATISGVKTVFSCETEVSSPSLENPSGGGSGLGNAEVKYKGCKPEGIAAEKGCKVETTANFASKMELTMVEGKTNVVLKPTGTNFANFSFSGCGIAALNGLYELKGTLRGLYSNSTSKIEFNAETTAEGLTLRGQKTTAVGSIGLETTGAGRIRAESEVRWYGCTKQAAGRYTSSTCTTEGAPNEWESVLLKAGEKTTVTAKGNPIAFTATISGVKTVFSCETEVTGASLENPSSGGSGLGNAEVKYKGCKPEGIAAEKGCKVETTANFASKMELTMVEGKTNVVLKPTGTNFANFSFSGCGIGALNGLYELKGTLRGLYSNASSKIEFNAETTAEGLTLRAQKTTAVGSIGLETTGAGRIRAE